jgi:Tfp pilus assembly protein PilX
MGGRVRPARQRRGVTTILAMMFLVLFGSLATAMAIASRGNIRTASSHLHVMRALGAAETGLEVGKKRLAEAAARFVVSNSNIDGEFATQTWMGEIPNGEAHTVLSPKWSAMESPAPAGIAEALVNVHAADQNVVPEVAGEEARIDDAPEGVSTQVYGSHGWVFTPAVGISDRNPEGGTEPAAYCITYAPLANGTDVRVISTGYDFNQNGNGHPIVRTVMQDFRISKRVNHAIISPSRILIGKNVMVTGDLGARYSDVAQTNGDPLVLKSDFWGVDATLNTKLTDFFNAVRGPGGPGTGDVDGDNRLRVGHPIEGGVIPSGETDYDGDGQPDGAFADVTGDGYVDEFDVFIKHFDHNGDGKVAMSSALSAGTPNAGLAPEFTTDEDLALLIDSSNPDRNKNRVYGWVDLDNDGKWDADEPMNDYDQAQAVYRDQVLGFRDGVIDKRDQYGKVRGRLVFKTSDSAWRTAQGNYESKLQGAIRPGEGQAAKTFSASDDLLPNLNADSFVDSEAGLRSASDGETFAHQVAALLGVSETQLSTYNETKPNGTTQPRFFRLDADADLDGLPDNWQTAYFEKAPFNSPSYSDLYYRPVYENMTFRDVQIPLGTNALFRKCTFIGVTYVNTTSGNTHSLFNLYGKMKLDTGTGRPVPDVVRVIYGNDTGETSYPTMLPSTAIPPNQMILMSMAKPMDKADIPENQRTSTNGYNLLADPLVINGKRVTDTKAYSNNLRFHDCMFIGSIVADKPSEYTQVRNKLQFTGATRFYNKHPDEPDNPEMNPQEQDQAEIAKSSMMLPNYSVDVGSFNSPPTQDIRLQGAVVAGVLDMRGNGSINGALFLTFAPVLGQGPMRDALGNPVGNPANFNASIGYFGPDDGDNESLDPATLPIVNGVKIVGWDTDGDGLADVAPSQAQPPNSTAVPFYGYGGINLRFDPSMVMPSGIMLPMSTTVVAGTYREGKPW